MKGHRATGPTSGHLVHDFGQPGVVPGQGARGAKGWVWPLGLGLTTALSSK